MMNYHTCQYSLSPFSTAYCRILRVLQSTEGAGDQGLRFMNCMHWVTLPDLPCRVTQCMQFMNLGSWSPAPSQAVTEEVVHFPSKLRGEIPRNIHVDHFSKLIMSGSYCVTEAFPPPDYQCQLP